VPAEVREHVRAAARPPGQINPLYSAEGFMAAFRRAWENGEELQYARATAGKARCILDRASGPH
jgi:hypothetical protein